MAEFALGLTKTAVEGTLVRVKSAIGEEAELKEKVRNDLVFITGEFEMMRSFLYAANPAERAKNPVARTWVRQLRDLAFDVEDCVEFVVHLDTKKSDWWWRVVPSCIRPPLPVDVAVTQIQQLKARVEDVSKRNARYNLIGDDSVPPNQLNTPASAASSSSSPFDVLSEVWDAAGKLRGTGDLRKLITSEGGDLQVISLWQGSCSTGGGAHHLEAAYIIKKAYDDPEICDTFKSRAWIKLMHPFYPDEFLKTLLAQFYPPSSKALAGAEFRKKMRAAVAEEDDYTKAELMKQVSEEQSYLVILEGVSSMVEWQAIRMYLTDSNKGSRIVVSTEHLRIALLCMPEQYQVSQLTRFSDGQFLCAFSNKGSLRRSDIGEFNWRIRCGGVISVVNNSYAFRLVPRVYKCIVLKHKGFDGVAFEKHSWVDVKYPFDINNFALHLFLNFQTRNFEPKEIAEVGQKGDQGVVERCCKYLHEYSCLVVINGLRSLEDWDKIKTTLLSYPTAKGKRTSVVVITQDESLAKHCILKSNRVFDIKALKDDEVLHRLINQDTGISRGMDDSLFYNRRDEKIFWDDFELDGRYDELSTLERLVQTCPGVISVWGDSGAGKSTLVRKFYYQKVFIWVSVKYGFTQVYSWVDVPCPFDLIDFSWRLLLDFQSTYETKVAAAARLMKGQDPVEACCEFLHETKHFLVVIDGLQSKHDWDIIRKAIFSKLPTQSGSCIIVITKKKSVARRCVDDNQDRLLKVKRRRDGESLHLPSVKDSNFFVGRGKEKCDLIEQLQSPGVISLWGIAGIGKSALVRNIYNNRMDMDCQYGREKQHKMSWVDVPHPFHLIEFGRRLLLGFYSKDLHGQETAAVCIMEGQDTVQACCNFLHQYKCLVVIDGLESTHDWDLIKAAFLSESTQSSCVIVITTEEIVATHCQCDKRRVHNIKGMHAEDSRHLFTKIAGGSQRLASETMALVKVIMTKCGGLPRVIVAIGEYLAQEISKINQQDFRETLLTTTLGDISDDFMGKLETDPRFHGLKSLFSWMQSYFDACSDSLKPCIFYLSVFQSDKRIRRRRLLRRWIAEGYSRDTSDGGTAEENGQQLFAELVESSIIQLEQTPNSNNKVHDDACQINGFFLEYIISRQMEDNLVFTLEGCCSLNSQRAGQHLTIRSCWDRDQIVYESIDFSRLRSLTVFGEWSSFFISNDRNMELLRVLDLEDTKSGLTDDVLEQIGKSLPRLKFLSVRGCKDITRLPHSIGGLKQLQTLDIRHTKIARLPHAIIELVKLQYIRAGTGHETFDEGGNACVPSSGEEDCKSTSSEGSSSSSEDGDPTVIGVETPQVDDDDDNLMMRSQPPPLASASGDETSRSQQLARSDGDCTSGKLPGTADGDNTSITQRVASDGGCTSTSLVRTAGTRSTSTHTTDQAAAPAAENCADTDDTSTRQQAADASWRSKARNALVSYYSCSWFPKKTLLRAYCGVNVPAPGIGGLTALHTFGVVNVSGKAVLEELKKLTQLHKLGVCGINRENWHDLCCNISGHRHLESLSVHLDKDDGTSFFSSATTGTFSNLPKTLKSLKLYTSDGHGNVQVPPGLMTRLGSLDNLSNITKGNLNLTISTQEDIDILAKLPNQGLFCHVCVKPAQDGPVYYGWRRDEDWRGGNSGPLVLEVDCGTYDSDIHFGPYIPRSLEVLVVRCSSTQSLIDFSSLKFLHRLKQIRLKGSYSEVQQRHLQWKVSELPQRILVKLEDEQKGETVSYYNQSGSVDADTDYQQPNTGGYHEHQYPYPLAHIYPQAYNYRPAYDMFNDDDPNSCSVM